MLKFLKVTTSLFCVFFLIDSESYFYLLLHQIKPGKHITLISSLKMAIKLETLWLHLYLWWSLSERFYWTNSQSICWTSCLCVWIVSTCLKMGSMHRPPLVFLELKEGVSAGGWCFCYTMMFCTLCWLCVEGEWIEMNSCHYLSVHVCMFVNPAETKIIKLLQLLSHILSLIEKSCKWLLTFYTCHVRIRVMCIMIICVLKFFPHKC